MTLSEKIMFIGNPGAGKSTLLNCIMRERDSRAGIFVSGVSIAKGLSYQLEERNVGGSIFMDTPGLEDVEMRQNAAKAVTQALRKGGRYKIVFVVTLESGRVRPEDAATIKIVLQSAIDITHYGIILNKLSKAIIQRFSRNEVDKKAVLQQLSLQENRSVSSLMLPGIEDLEDLNNAVTSLPALVKFVNTLPYVNVNEHSVTQISNNNNFEVYTKKAREIREIEEKQEKLKQKSEADKRAREAEAARAIEATKRRQAEALKQEELRQQQENDRIEREYQQRIYEEALERNREQERRQAQLAAAQKIKREREEELQRQHREEAARQESQRKQQEQRHQEQLRQAQNHYHHHQSNDPCCIL